MTNARPKRPAPERSAARATYAFCVVGADRKPAAARAPAAPGLGAIRVVPAGDGLYLVAADAPLPEYEADAINDRLRDIDWVGERALVHERVVEHFTRAGTVVPMKLFTLFHSDERAIDHVRRTGDVARLVRALAGKQEWGVRVSLDAARVRRDVGTAVAKDAARLSAGTSFLVKRQREQSEARDSVEKARQGAEEIFDRLQALAADSRRRPPPAPSRLLLDAAFLVKEDRVAAFRKAAASLSRAHEGDGLALSVTGPWPAYNFLSEAK